MHCLQRLLSLSCVGILFSSGLAALPLHAQDLSQLGGDLTSDLPGRSAIQVNAPNVTDEARRILQLEGFGLFHGNFTAQTGLGPGFNNASCGGCHLDNGRGPTKFSRGNTVGSTMIVKVSLKGLQSNGAPKDVPGVGEQLADHSTGGTERTKIRLSFVPVTGGYPDGTKYTLRRPVLDYRLRTINRRKLVESLRMTPPVIGPGLLEAIEESKILELSDPKDLDGDGISGRPNYVPNIRTGQKAIGRFGFKASNPTAEQQSASALVHDMGVTNPLFLGTDTVPEFSEKLLNTLTIYQKLAGVPRPRFQNDSKVIHGKKLFQEIGCNKCHVVTMTTGDYVDPELSNQTFHPFTDLLLHDMGKGLADKRAEFSAKGSEWRTTPLWGLGFSRTLNSSKKAYLHDGRARTFEEAILWHGGEASLAQLAFKFLTKTERAQLLAFLDSL